MALDSTTAQAKTSHPSGLLGMESQMVFTAEELAIRDSAIGFAKANKKAIARRLTCKDRYSAEQEPVSVFMSGSAGAGKTEASIELLNLFSDQPILRIDPDELRNEFADYQGGNAYLFQGAMSIS
uniref:zeta toxin family protein n=1 Tax=Pseudomonas vlassakiae TaxID=485888 RepID=UPI00290573AC|nr:zeta toxin family protein [Pseudomonas vlassakiae]